MVPSEYSKAEANVANWVKRAAAEFHGWDWRVAENWKGGWSRILVEGTSGTLAEAVQSAAASGYQGILTVKPTASADLEHGAGSIPYLHGLIGRIEDGRLVNPTDVWPSSDRKELSIALGVSPESLELTVASA